MSHIFPNGGDKWDAGTRFPYNSVVKWYMFKNEEYWRYSTLSKFDQLDPDSNYPKSIKAYWYELPQLFQKNIDATLYFQKEKILYIFKQTKYGLYRYDDDKFVNNSMRNISTDWHGLPSRVDAAVFVEALDMGYIFRGNQYWRVNVSSKMADNGYPKSISSLLRGREQSESNYSILGCIIVYSNYLCMLDFL